MKFEQLTSKQGDLMRAFFVRNRSGKVMAIGTVPTDSDPGFCLMHSRRMEHDKPLVTKVQQIAGVSVRLSPEVSA